MEFAFDVVNSFDDSGESSTSNGVDFFIIDPSQKVMKMKRKEERDFMTVDLKEEGEYSIIISNQKERKKTKHISLAIETTLAHDLFDRKMGRESSLQVRDASEFNSKEELEEY